MKVIKAGSTGATTDAINVLLCSGDNVAFCGSNPLLCPSDMNFWCYIDLGCGGGGGSDSGCEPMNYAYCSAPMS